MNELTPGLIRLPSPHPERGLRGARILILSLTLTAAAYVFFETKVAQPWSGTRLRASEFVSGIPTITDDLKLVVSVLEVHKSVMAESEKKVLGVDLGTTRVSLSMPAKLHYAIDLSGPGPVQFRLDPERRELTATFPDPRLQAVELLGGKKQVAIETGWARLKSMSGHALQDGLERGLYDTVRSDGSTPAVVEQVKERARPLLTKLLNDYARRAGALGPDGISVTKVRFKSDADGERLALLRPRD